MDQMRRIQATEDGNTPQSGDPVFGSAPPMFEVVGNPVVGKPWRTGLFDCHEDQTNVATSTDPMGRIEITELDGTPQGVQQLAQPAAMETISQHQEHAGINYGIPQDYSTGGVVNNLLIGRPWTVGLFDCHEHPVNAVMTAILPCVTFGQIAEVLDGGEMTCPLGSFIYLLMMPALCSQWIMGSKYRTKLRQKYDLVEAPYEDKISHIFCPCCSLCQEFRELKIRGLDPALGWNGILAQQQGRQYQDQVTIPPPNQEMYK